MKNRFALSGAAGFVAPRHMQAIRDTGNSLVAVFDPHDTLGVLDRYFPEAFCFSEQAAFSDFLSQNQIDYFTICAPNHLHFEQISLGLRHGANVICEKPLLIDPTLLDKLESLESEMQRSVKTILQLRLLPAVSELRKTLQRESSKVKVEVQYVTARGNWYFNSWKGHDDLSGGLITNIGIHLFDLMIWLFGSVEQVQLTQKNRTRAEGKLVLERAEVDWMLSIDPNDLPHSHHQQGKRSFRVIRIGGQELRLDDGLEGLHTQCYCEILSGGGPGISDAAPSIRLCRDLMNM